MSEGRDDGASVKTADQGTHDVDVDVIVIGAGFAGLYALHRLRRLGLRVQGFETGKDVGGTWYWNKYPGARCDVPSMEYSYSFSKELQQRWEWTERFASQPEILRYMGHVADQFELRRLIAFESRVIQADWDDAASMWTIRTDRGQLVRARYLIAATGCLSAARVPDMPGLADFKGNWYHSGRWPETPVDFTGRRVGVIGTGSSGIQIIPEVAKQAAHTYVFQRTANFVVPARNRPMTEEERRDYKRDYDKLRRYALDSPDGMVGVGHPADKAAHEDSESARAAHYEKRWAFGGAAAMLTAYKDLIVDRDSNETAGEFVRNKIRGIVKNHDLAEALAPRDHYFGTKRLCQDAGYFETYNRGDVSLVDVKRTPIRKITADGIIVGDSEIKLDTLVFATGYDAVTGPLLDMNVRGAGGRTLADKWAEGPRVYLGLVTAGFPNLFIVTGPGSPSVKGNMVLSIEQHVNFIVDCIDHLSATGRHRIDADAGAEDAWCDHVREVADKTLFPLADSWYVGANIPGKPRVFLPYVGGIPAYRQRCEQVVANGYEGFTIE